MYAEQLPSTEEGDIRLGYGLTPQTASIPGPLIVLTEGDCIDITLHNNIPRDTLLELRKKYEGGGHLPLGVSIHPHGVKYDRDSDGTAMNDSFVPPGESRVFTWRTVPLMTAGYWWYHDHVVGTHHGTGGIASGLFGGLIVRRNGDPRPDVPTFVVAFGDNFTINLEHFPETPKFTAEVGQRIEFLVFAWGNAHHTFHLHGHSWADNRTGIIDVSDPYLRVIDDKSVGPGDSFGFQVIAGREVGPAKWMYHCHVQIHSDLGMTGILRVTSPRDSEGGAEEASHTH